MSAFEVVGNKFKPGFAGLFTVACEFDIKVLVSQSECRLDLYLVTGKPNSATLI